LKTYTFKLVIKEGNHGFWEGIKGTGCDEVHDALLDCLDGQGLIDDKNQLTLQKFEDESDD
jgi:hypothetical protein